MTHRLLGVLWLAACSASQPDGYTVDTLPSGAVRIANHAPSGWADSNGLQLVLDHTIAPANGAPGELTFPLLVRTLADGRIVVNDGSGAGIILFAADGTFERVLGRHGEGPGEYGQIFSMATHGSTVFVQECNKGRLTRFHLDGDSTSQWPSDDCMAGEGVVVDVKGEPWLDGRLREPTRSVLFHWRWPGERLDTFFLPVPREPALWMAGNAAVPIPFSPHSVWTGVPPRVWSGHGSALTLYQVNGMGDTIRVATLPGSAQSIPDSVRQAMIDRYTASPRFAAVVHAPDVPTAHPLFTALDVDELGRLWIHRPGPDGSPAHFEVLDSTGIWLGTVRAPRGAARSPHWAHGRMYRIGETAGGMPAIEIYRLEGPRP